MPQVPQYGGRKVQDAGLPGGSIANGGAPSEAFGGGAVAASADRARRGLAEAATNLFQAEQAKTDQIQAASKSALLEQKKNDRQREAMSLRGADAARAVDVLKGFDDDAEEVFSGATNDRVAMALQRDMARQRLQLDEAVQTHVSQQARVYDEQENKAFIQTSRDTAVLNANDDNIVNGEVERQSQATIEWARRNGIPEDSAGFTAELNGRLSQTHHGVISSRIDSGNVAGARAYLESRKTQMTAPDLMSAKRDIENLETLEEGMKSYSGLKTFRLSDGSPDLGRMQAQVMSREDLTLPQKMKIADFVKAKAGEDYVNQNKREQARERSFINQALQAKQEGRRMEDVLKMVPKVGGDTYEQAMRMEQVKKMFSAPTETDQPTYIRLWEGVQSGKITKEEIDQASQQGKINSSDWRGLREDYFKSKVSGNNPVEKQAWERVKILADEQFGSSKEDKDKFIYTLRQQSQDKTPDEIVKMAQDKLKDSPESGWFFSKKQYQADFERIDAESMAWGKLYEEVGQSQISAIGVGVLATGKKKWGPADVDAFAAQFGGYSSLRAGTPVNNAILSLQKRQKPVTPANVKALLERYPDGTY